MKHAGGDDAPSYNVQISTDAAQKVIVGVEVGQNASDAVLLQPALQTLERRLGQLPRQLVADGGYATQSNIADLAARDIDSMRGFRRRTKIRTHCASAASHRHFFRNSFATTQAATSSSVRRERRCTTARNRSAVTASCTYTALGRRTAAGARTGHSARPDIPAGVCCGSWSRK
jgi:hypothetical protein